MVRLKEKRGTAQKEENISHPSRYILQTLVSALIEPTIRGQPGESKPPLSPCGGHKARKKKKKE